MDNKMDNNINFKLACDDLDILNMESMIFSKPITKTKTKKYSHKQKCSHKQNFVKYLAELKK
jgi:hypothetical protein